MGALMRSVDWANTAVGPVTGWPQSLRTALSILLETGFPMYIAWGAEFTQFYNDGYRPILGSTKHPRAMGISTRATFAEIWDIIGPMFNGVMAGTPVTLVDFMLPLDRHGFAEECYFVFSYSPIREESGAVGGVLVTVTETTARVLGARRLATLQALAGDTRDATTVARACDIAARVLAGNRDDVPFAHIYLPDREAGNLRLAGSSAPPADAGPALMALSDATPWPVGEVVATGVSQMVSLSGPAGRAMVLPVMQQGSDKALAVLVAAISPRLLLDDDYRSFLSLIATHIGAAMASAQALEEAKARADALADLDRAKTAFFSNVSHEFRTPLTLLLGPIEDALATSDGTLGREQLSLVHRNGQRLLRLVNTLLDFSRIEAGRTRASFQQTDIGALTREVASTFHSLMAHGGLRLDVACETVTATAYVDQAMWEQIVLNLLSNAFKFTFAGSVSVALREIDGAFELRVSDTGTGIPATQLPHVFDRFRRIEGARSRSFEGSGIGLALVIELVRIHGGTIDVASEEGVGTTFVVRVPTGSAHLDPDRLSATKEFPPRHSQAMPFVEEARRWLTEPPPERAAPASVEESPVPAREGLRARVLVVDDNVDMREYLTRILGLRWAVETAADGAAAFEAARQNPPDLVLTDVMMPRAGGFELLRALRDDDRTRLVPIVMLSARAGEESRVEGLTAGANDYLVKPFAARELVARVSTQLEMSRLRRALSAEAERLRDLFEQAPVGVSVVAGPEHRFEFANRVYLAMTHRDRGIVGKRYVDAFPEVRGTDLPGILDRVYATGEPFVADDYRVELEHLDTGERQDHFLKFHLTPIRDGGGTLNGLLTVVVDVTDQVTARRVIQEARNEAERASRAKDEFLAILGHELRNPLAPILTAVHLMRLRDADRFVKERTVIERQATHLVRLVDDLLDVSRIARGKITLRTERVEMGELVAYAVEQASPLLETQAHNLEIDVPSSGLPIEVDKSRFGQVVSNLLTNAAKYTERGGRISLRARRDGQDVVLSVRDNGVGIAPEMLPRVFDMFAQEPQSSDRSRGGLGLGLTIVRSLTLLHGGRVEARSEGLGKGSEFIVRVPVAPPLHVGDAGERKLLAPAAHRPAGVGVLIVDDNEDAATLLAEALAAEGHRTRTAFDGPTALRVAAEFKPAVAIVDLGLPGMDGYELAARLKEGASPERMEVVALSGYGQESDRRRTEREGFAAHFVKPVDVAELGLLLGKLGPASDRV